MVENRGTTVFGCQCVAPYPQKIHLKNQIFMLCFLYMMSQHSPSIFIQVKVQALWRPLQHLKVVSL